MPLKPKLLQRIQRLGPLSLADFMAAALWDSDHGYYATRHPIGRSGDFITAPEISQLFGEMIGLWLIDTWEKIGRPRPLQLVELGPGRGLLLADVLRTLRLAPELDAALSLHLIEASPTLRALQEKQLSGRRATWHQDLSTLPDAPLLLIANEFFDALPIRQYERLADGWHERLVGLAPEGQALSFVFGPALPAAPFPEAPLGAVLESSPASQAIIGDIARRIIDHGGAALVIDYGYAVAPMTGTFQAVARHGHCDPLADPGSADLSALVDFAALSKAAKGAKVQGPIGQGAFLEGLGIKLRAAQLAKKANDRQRAELESALARLTQPDQMGQLFKALALLPPGAPDPLGFA